MYTEAEGLKWLELPLLREAGVRHGFFTRHGDLSNERIKRALQLTTICRANQVHGTCITLASERQQQADGLVTSMRSVGLAISHADCQPAFVFDPKQPVLAALHCGWKGQVANFYGKAIQYLEGVFGSRPADLLVAIGPSLGPTRAEFRHYRTEFPEWFWKYQPRPNYFDLWQIAQEQLKAAGVRHIEIARICTVENRTDWFSYRGQDESARGVSVASL